MHSDGRVCRLRVAFRIHNADTAVKRSGLKFDVQLKGWPTSMYAHHILVG